MEDDDFMEKFLDPPQGGKSIKGPKMFFSGRKVSDVFGNSDDDEEPVKEPGDLDKIKAEYPLAPKEAFKPNDGQQTAIDWLIEFCQGKQPFKRTLLEGYAGTGKTWTINRVVEALFKIDRRISFGMTAPTHKAVRQLYRHSELKDSLDFGTIHSFLGLKIKLIPNPKKRNEQIESFVPDPEVRGGRKIDQISVLILDEASMLSDELYEYIDDVIRSTNLRVIFMGDGLQIPPVGKKDEKGATVDAIPFVPSQRESRKIHLLRLSEIVRQGAGNPIIEYSAAIREQHMYQSIKWENPQEEPGETGVESLPRDITVLRNLFTKLFCGPEFEEDPDYAKVVCWRNSTTDYFNKEIRLLINKAETLPKIIPGDKLVLSKPYFIGKTMLPNNEELDVMSLQVVARDIPYIMIDREKNAFKRVQMDDDIFADTGKKHLVFHAKQYTCVCKAMDGREYTVAILHEELEAEYTRIREDMVKSAKKCEMFEQKEMWRQFYDMEKKFATVTYNYCLTAHKAQGSTYNYCISMEWDIDQAREYEERNRIRYVAATRARHKLFIVK